MFQFWTVFTLSWLVSALAIAVQANDANMFGASGSWRFMNAEHRFIRMEREMIAMTVRPDTDAEVIADFWFYNSGPATTVTMGFPESSGGEAYTPDNFRRRSDLIGFRSWIDGRLAKVRRVVARLEDKHPLPGDGRAYWIKKVRFGRYQRRRVRVRYTTSGGSDSSLYQSHSYAFTGGNWHGLVAESVLTVRFLPRGSWFVSGQGWKGNQFIFKRHNWEAEGEYELSFIATLPYAATNSRNGVGWGKSWTFIQNPGFDLDRGLIRVGALPTMVQEGRNRWLIADEFDYFPVFDSKGKPLHKNDMGVYPVYLRWNETKKHFIILFKSRRFIVDRKSAVRNSARPIKAQLI